MKDLKEWLDAYHGWSHLLSPPLKAPAHWRHGHKKYFGLTLKPILRDIRNTF